MKTESVPSQSQVASLASHTLPFVLEIASVDDRIAIYRARHEVYARELGQHAANAAGRLRDTLDDDNVYLVARVDGELGGFVSITPAGQPTYSIDKYFARASLPFAVDEGLCEVRLLTVLKEHRGRELATLLMYGALRWVEAHGGKHIAALGRREVLDLYFKVGLQSMDRRIESGAITYELLHATVAALREQTEQFGGLLERLEERTDWRLPFSFRKPAACFHGGAFFAAIGERFNHLERAGSIINADVLDAWFPPAPGVLAALGEHLPWLLRTSPPTDCRGLIETIATARGVKPENILPGAGSSDLIFRALRHWLTPRSHALILEPTYGEYAHVLERVIGCTVDRLTLRRQEGYEVNLARLETAFADKYDLVVLVNPNSPTGQHIPRCELETLLRRIPQRTRAWVDETYIEYAGPGESLEAFAAQSENIVVCKSMSKVYALSGARAAYLCAGPHQLEALRAITPPWVVSLPAQVAAVRALQELDYYRARWIETAGLREELASGLAGLGCEVLPGVANFLLCHLPEDGPDAATLVRRCRERDLFIRDTALMGASMGGRTVRIAVKDRETNERMLRILSEVADTAFI